MSTMCDFDEIQRKADAERLLREERQQRILDNIHHRYGYTPNTLESTNNPSPTYVEQIRMLQEENKLLLARNLTLTRKIAILEGQKGTSVAKEEKPKTEFWSKFRASIVSIYQDFIKWLNA